ncbi:cytochrome b [Herbaspirillum sp. RV1423]|uniref:cytochrome b n=1 Tax=Herbaspirillum sp. RV1423 TaxID=1443993 RepID=UPI0004BB5E05|nr:cytochrome b [Herbaspirillum sp. RV1423]
MHKKTYHPLSIALHWLIFFLFAIALAVIEYRDGIPKGAALRDILRTLHMHAGQLVFLFALLRLLARLRYGAPAELSASDAQRLAAHTVHVLLYALMFALPITGILFTQAGGREVVFFGLHLPTLIDTNPGLRSTIKNFHELMGNGIYFLVALHIAGALWHQFVDKAPVLRRMSFKRADNEKDDE